MMQLATLVETPPYYDVEQRRTVFICFLAAVIAAGAVAVSRLFIALLALFTNLSFFGRLSLAESRPWDNHLGPFVIVVPGDGALIVGVMGRHGSEACHGHGIPE